MAAEPVPVSVLVVEVLGRELEVVQAAPVAPGLAPAARAGQAALVVPEVQAVVAEAAAEGHLIRAAASGTLVRAAVEVAAATVRAAVPAAVVAVWVVERVDPAGLAADLEEAAALEPVVVLVQGSVPAAVVPVEGGLASVEVAPKVVLAAGLVRDPVAARARGPVQAG